MLPSEMAIADGCIAQVVHPSPHRWLPTAFVVQEGELRQFFDEAGGMNRQVPILVFQVFNRSHRYLHNAIHDKQDIRQYLQHVRPSSSTSGVAPISKCKIRYDWFRDDVNKSHNDAQSQLVYYAGLTPPGHESSNSPPNIVHIASPTEGNVQGSMYMWPGATVSLLDMMGERCRHRRRNLEGIWEGYYQIRDQTIILEEERSSSQTSHANLVRLVPTCLTSPPAWSSRLMPEHSILLKAGCEQVDGAGRLIGGYDKGSPRENFTVDPHGRH
ncbi:hypothetical protein BDQ12DRAFT_665491 [Crucibulum laeve]|uniref:Uncharacterized protein n=1 Tax=Crucibulum laeve TaxID=68775 RepID=A0A5C3M5M1_9AGAR|nr:hypothetical protein BDQ12DRAFT_665491 [Crucibulum laeve]